MEIIDFKIEFRGIFFTGYIFFYFSSKLKHLNAHRSRGDSNTWDVSHAVIMTFKILLDGIGI